MNDTRNRARLLATIAAAASLTFPLSAAADGCTFRGEIVYADDYRKIVIDRADPARAGQSLGPHAPIYPGDTLLVQGDQVIWIRDAPGGELRELTQGDGRVTIAQPETCDVRDGFKATLGGLMSSLKAIIGGPVADQPVPTYPTRSNAGEPDSELSPTGIELNLSDQQLVTSDIVTLGIHWKGMEAKVLLASSNAQDTPLVAAEAKYAPFIDTQLSRPLVVGERLQLVIATELGSVARSIRVVPRDVLPKPASVQSLDDLSPAEAAVYAIWLATEGPPEWRLQGMTLLSETAREDYMAWKVLRGLRAGALE